MKYSVEKYIARLSGKERTFSVFGEGEVDFDYFKAFEAESLPDQQTIFAKCDDVTKWQILFNWCFYKKGFKTKQQGDFDKKDWSSLARIVETSAEWLKTTTEFNQWLNISKIGEENILLAVNDKQKAFEVCLFVLVRIFYESQALRPAISENAELLVAMRLIADEYRYNDDVLEFLISDQKFFEDVWNNRGLLQASIDDPIQPRRKREFSLKNEPWLVEKITPEFLWQKSNNPSDILLTNFWHFQTQYPEDIKKFEQKKIELRDFGCFVRFISMFNASDSVHDLTATLACLRIAYKILTAHKEGSVCGFYEDLEVQVPCSNTVLQFFKSYIFGCCNEKNLIARLEAAVRLLGLQAVEILGGFEPLMIFELSEETLMLLFKDLMQDKKYSEYLELASYGKSGSLFSELKAVVDAIAQDPSSDRCNQLLSNRLFSEASLLGQAEKEFLQGYAYQQFGCFAEAYEHYFKAINTPDCPIALVDEARFLIGHMLYVGQIAFNIDTISGKSTLVETDSSKSELLPFASLRACQAYEFWIDNSHPEAKELVGRARHRLNGFNGMEIASDLNELGIRIYTEYLLQKHHGKIGCRAVAERIKQEQRLFKEQKEQEQRLLKEQKEQKQRLSRQIASQQSAILEKDLKISSLEMQIALLGIRWELMQIRHAGLSDLKSSLRSITQAQQEDMVMNTSVLQAACVDQVAQASLSSSSSSSSSIHAEPVGGIVVHPSVLNQNVGESSSVQTPELELATSVQNRK